MEWDATAYACLDPVYIDGIAGILNLGCNVAMCYFRWQPVRRNGLMVYERAPALYVVRPRASISSSGAFARMLDGQPAPRVAARSVN
jgi:hypothetical protein